MESDTLAIVIPAFNSEITIGRALKSVFLCKPDQVIVVDDGSNDDTGEIAASHGAQVIRQANGGAAAARRSGLAHVRTRRVIFLDADDMLIPAGVASIIDEWPVGGASVVGGRVRVLSSEGKSGRKLRQTHGPGVLDFAYLLQRGGSPWPPCGAVWDVEAAKATIRSRELGALLDTRFAEDYEWLIRASILGRVILTSHTVGLYEVVGGKSQTFATAAASDVESIRRHYSMVTGIEVREPEEFELQVRILKRHLRGSLAHHKPLEAARTVTSLVALHRDRMIAKFRMDTTSH